MTERTQFIPFEVATKRRLVGKNGEIMFEVKNVNERWRFIVDLFTSLIVLKWRWVLLIFCASYVLSWLVFGSLWALLVVIYGPGYCVDQVGNRSGNRTCQVHLEDCVGAYSRKVIHIKSYYK